MGRARARRLAFLIVLAASCLVTSARAQRNDTSYGRIDGDLSASVGAGATFGARGPRGAADLRLRYLWTVGIFATYEDGPSIGSAAEPKRALAAGLELRPLFLAFWLQGKDLGNAYWDLTIDSLGLELGAVFMQPAGAAFASRPGLQAGLGLQLPILPRATGPAVGVHAGGRWSESALGGHDIDGPSDRAFYLLVTLGWQQVFSGHVVDLGDRAP